MRLLSREGRERFLRLPMSEAVARQRGEWLSLVDELNARIKSLDAWLEGRARHDERVLRLQTHPGIGLLTSLALVRALEPVGRFGGGRKVAAYVGLDPMEYSSGEKQRFGSISKGGSRLLRYLLVEADDGVQHPDGRACFPAAAPHFVDGPGSSSIAKSTFTSSYSFLPVRDDDLLRSFGQGGDEPSEQERGRGTAQKLRDDEAGHVHRPDAGEGV